MYYSGNEKYIKKYKSEKLKGKSPLGRPMCSWGYNIRIYLRETAWKGVD
jgi:hypothetical protein